MPQHPWTQEPWDLDVLFPQQRRVVEDDRCPHGRSVLLDCAACPDPIRTLGSDWIETACCAGLLLLSLVVLVVCVRLGVQR